MRVRDPYTGQALDWDACETLPPVGQDIPTRLPSGQWFYVHAPTSQSIPLIEGTQTDDVLCAALTERLIDACRAVRHLADLTQPLNDGTDYARHVYGAAVDDAQALAVEAGFAPNEFPAAWEAMFEDDEIDTVSLLDERSEEVGGISYLVNPTHDQLLGLANREKELRGMSIGKDYIWWPATLSIHFDMAKQLGLTDQDAWYKSRLDLRPDEGQEPDNRVNGGAGYAVTALDYGNGLSHPQVKKLHLKGVKNQEGNVAILESVSGLDERETIGNAILTDPTKQEMIRLIRDGPSGSMEARIIVWDKGVIAGSADAWVHKELRAKAKDQIHNPSFGLYAELGKDNTLTLKIPAEWKMDVIRMLRTNPVTKKWDAETVVEDRDFDTVSLLDESIQLDEGVYDDNALKAIFIIGAGGSGKGDIAREMFGGAGLKQINPDKNLERLLAKASIPGTQVGSEYGLFNRARDQKDIELNQYATRRLGLLIDGTGRAYDQIAAPVKRLRAIGYDCYMVFVDASLETSLRRNAARGKAGGRQVPDSFILAAHGGVHSLKDDYRQLFGPKRFFWIKNDKDISPMAWKSKVAPTLARLGKKILSAPLMNPAGIEWLRQQSAGPGDAGPKPDRAFPKKPPRWMPPAKPYPSSSTLADLPKGAPPVVRDPRTPVQTMADYFRKKGPAKTGFGSGTSFKPPETKPRKKRNESIDEAKKETVHGITYYVNPTWNELHTLAVRSKFGRMRGVPDGDDVYWWDAYMASHEEFTRMVLSMLNDGDRSAQTLEYYNEPAPMMLLIHGGKPANERVKKLVQAVKNEGGEIDGMQSDEAKKEEQNGVTYYVNPTPAQIQALADKSRFGEVRGLSDGKDTYWWESAQITHDAFASKIMHVSASECTRAVYYSGNGSMTPDVDKSELWYSGKPDALAKLIAWVKQRDGIVNVRHGPTPDESLDEAKKETVHGITYYVNPTLTELHALAKNSEHGIMRGIVDGENLDWWDAASPTHDEFSRYVLGKPLTAQTVFYVAMGYKLVVAVTTTINSRLKDLMAAVKSKGGEVIRGSAPDESILSHFDPREGCKYPSSPQMREKGGSGPANGLVEQVGGDATLEESDTVSLSEVKIEKVDGKSYYVNPTLKELKGLSRKAKTQSLRGTSSGGDLYWWDSWDMTHDDFAKATGLSVAYPMLFHYPNEIVWLKSWSKWPEGIPGPDKAAVKKLVAAGAVGPFLNEVKTEFFKGVRYVVNPTAQEVVDFAKRNKLSGKTALRWVIDKKTMDVYFFSAERSTHYDLILGLGIEEPATGFASADSGKLEISGGAGTYARDTQKLLKKYDQAGEGAMYKDAGLPSVDNKEANESDTVSLLGEPVNERWLATGKSEIRDGLAYDVFINPTAKDLKEVGDSLRALLYPNGDVVAWDGENDLHDTVERRLKRDDEPIYLKCRHLNNRWTVHVRGDHDLSKIKANKSLQRSFPGFRIDGLNERWLATGKPPVWNPGLGYDVFLNPTPVEFNKLMKGPSRSIRALVFANGDLVTWGGDEDIHDNVIQQIQRAGATKLVVQAGHGSMAGNRVVVPSGGIEAGDAFDFDAFKKAVEANARLNALVPNMKVVNTTESEQTMCRDGCKCQQCIDEDGGPANPTVASKLPGFIKSNPGLHKMYLATVVRPIRLYKAKKTYRREDSPKLAKHLVKTAGMAYHAAHGDKTKPWHHTFNQATRSQAMSHVRDTAERDAAAGAVDSTLPKKYRPGFKGY